MDFTLFNHDYGDALMIIIDIDSSQLQSPTTVRGIAAVGHKILRQFLAHFYCVNICFITPPCPVQKGSPALSLHSAVSVMCKY